MTRHVISKTVITQMEIEIALMVGRSLKMVEMRDPTFASVALCNEYSSGGDNVEFSCVAEDGRGSPPTCCAIAIRATVKQYGNIMF